jgi:hypothetical protein
MTLALSDLRVAQSMISTSLHPQDPLAAMNAGHKDFVADSACDSTVECFPFPVREFFIVFALLVIFGEPQIIAVAHNVVRYGFDERAIGEGPERRIFGLDDRLLNYGNEQLHTWRD